jgi:opacity protein-like surface antigen
MKKILALVVGLGLTLSVSFAADSPDTTKGFYLGLAVGADFPGSNWPSGWPTGKGGELSGAYMFNKNIGLELDLDHFLSSQTGLSEFSGEYTLNFKYLFDGNGVQPFLMAGLGTNVVILSPAGYSSTISSNSDFAFTGGVQFDLGNKLYLYVEAKANIATNNGGSSSDFPLLAGLNFKL